MFLFFLSLALTLYLTDLQVTTTSCDKYSMKGHGCNATIMLDPKTGIVSYYDVTSESGKFLRWGNWLSPYWHNRAIAEIGNLDFRFPGGFSSTPDTWIQYLPSFKMSCQYSSEFTKNDFDEICNIPDCNTADPRQASIVAFPHETCKAVYRIGATIQNETQAAMKRWAKEKKIALLQQNDDDVVIYIRCNFDAFLTHRMYGPTGFKIYLNIPNSTKRIYVVHDVSIEGYCKSFQSWLQEFLSSHFPNAKIIDHTSSIFEDFAMIVFSKFAIVETSTFGLFSGLASSGHVYMPTICNKVNATVKSDKFHLQGTILLPSLATSLGLSIADMSKIKDWLFKN